MCGRKDFAGQIAELKAINQIKIILIFGKLPDARYL